MNDISEQILIVYSKIPDHRLICIYEGSYVQAKARVRLLLDSNQCSSYEAFGLDDNGDICNITLFEQ